MDCFNFNAFIGGADGWRWGDGGKGIFSIIKQQTEKRKKRPSIQKSLNF